jgi:hypothetical protein
MCVRVCVCGTGIWIWGFALARQALYHMGHSTSPFLCIEYFQDRVSRTICPGWLWTAIFLISAFWVARITGVNHQHPAIRVLMPFLRKEPPWPIRLWKAHLSAASHWPWGFTNWIVEETESNLAQLCWLCCSAGFRANSVYLTLRITSSLYLTSLLLLFLARLYFKNVVSVHICVPLPHPLYLVVLSFTSVCIVVMASFALSR